MDAGVAAGESVVEGDVLRARLVGTWRLLRWETIDADGSARQPFGPDPSGYVVYTDTGRMMTTISRAKRAPIGGDLLAAPAAGRAEAFASFVAYSGTYRVVDGEVHHDVEMSLFPDWVGTVQRRRAEMSLDGTTLVLRSVPMPGSQLQHVVRWERVRA